MFSTQEFLEKKTGPFGIGRESYLQSLVKEFEDTESNESKLQILANLANFAYDPINYDIMRRLNIIDLYLDTLSLDSSSAEEGLSSGEIEMRKKMREYALAGLCNCSLDRLNKEYIIAHDGVMLVTQCLSSDLLETVITAITTLMFLASPSSTAQLTTVPLIDAMLRLSNSRNTRLSNLANIYLTDYCLQRQVDAARQAQRTLDGV